MDRGTILKILKLAKETYINREKEDYIWNVGMCYHIRIAFKEICDRRIAYNDISYYIPEFNSKFLGGDCAAFWWDVQDTKSRIAAFDKLIKIYE